MSLQTVIDHLKLNMPGQTEEWYLRVATQIREANGDAFTPTTEPPTIPPKEPKRDTTYSYQKADIPALHRTEVVGVPERKAAAQTHRRNTSVNSVTKIKLYKLCGNDSKTAERLVSGIRLNNPKQSEQWCWEKAIWDLERDRTR